ncbi:galactosyl transferase [Bifidobacterium adolescentis]|uniref:Galactosyl transferase CpsD n=1 Tax=Bifidobacterium adolescentis (strain ATCC 15703 / DSM 20083 / NCTC 11814 / E194a) TaxID=367928 RepID=A1A387_BIFAA|nr:sugar transferase [Bifidobacterium adolescentis]MCT6789869.1 sugar transferase [Bifidobacterium adolescentis]NRD15534.1 sugar transferase [Bifidobacterium adolescentis]OSG96967.1 galactosyl transferase [Bifidobacterium adolescentis]SPU22902.1 galactosyl transferase CpsD [Bifidobacterium adolescentis]BAF40170.1 galactosyl transferase CpsD [Bifidobacterium adolescentis ATCC 15703]
MAYSGNSGEKLSETSRRHVLSVAYWRFFVNALLVLCDMAAFIIASAIVYVVRNTGDLYSTRFHFHIALWAYMLVGSLIWIYCLHSVGVYHRHVMGDGYQLNAFLIKGALFAGLMVCALNSILNVYVPLVTTGLALLCALLVTIVERFIIRQCVLFSREKGAYSYGTVVVGSLEGIEHALQFLSRKSQLNYHAIAVCPIGLDAQTGYVKAVDVTAEFKQRIREICGRDIATLPYCKNFAERAASMGVQTVMVTDVMHRFSDNFNTFVLDVEAMNLEVALITSAVDVSGHETNIRVIQGSTVMTISLPQYSPWAMFKKRVFDIVVSLMALVGTAIITIPVAIAIKVTDRGPIFYTQTRVGRRGKPFKMIKFRSMVVNADKMKSELAEQTGQKGRFIFKMKNDPRVTTVGRFIRKFSIDEFPQFLNVLRGDMSVVGPRPPLPEEVAQYNQTYATRMLVKPGITGPWQVSGRSNLSEEESEALDVTYVQNWSMLGDVVLLFRTVGAVVTHKGAY